MLLRGAAATALQMMPSGADLLAVPYVSYNNFVIYTMIAGYWSDLGPFLFEESEIAALVSLGNEGVI